MSDKTHDLEQELDRLVATGELIYWAMADDLGKLDEGSHKQLDEQGIKLPKFKAKYDSWYSVALRVVAQVVPDRLPDFIAQYKNEKRKEIDYLTYTISDYLLGLKTTRGYETVVDTAAALPKMERQVAILRAAKAVFKSSLADIAEVLQADLFDSELEAAAELCKRGFVRGAGAIAGVVLEKHLAHVRDAHGIKQAKKNPSINDLNQFLKDNSVIDTAKWRFIQHLTDLRNLCDHKKEREPTKDDVAELIEGVSKVIKTVS